MNPVLVTGINRSGTTWVGKMIHLSGQTGYIHEPFRPDHRPGILNKSIRHWYPYVCDENADEYRDEVREVVNYRYHILTELKVLRSPVDAGRLIRDGLRTNYSKITGKIPLIKDPIAYFSAPWLAKTFDMKVIVLIRHPAAYVNSILRAGWSHPFDHFLAQPLLMRDWLTDFKPEIEHFSRNPQPLLLQAILLWRIFYSTCLKFREFSADWLFVRHEDISTDPIFWFEKLYRFSRLRWTDRVSDKIKTFSSQRNPVISAGVNDIKRNSKENKYRWKHDLLPDQVQLISDKTSAIANHFYSRSEW